MKFDVNIRGETHLHLHHHGLPMTEVLHRLGEIVAELQKGTVLMNDIRQDVADVIKAFDDATNSIATRIDALIAASTGLTADEKAAFKVETDKLASLGSGGTVPTP